MFVERPQNGEQGGVIEGEDEGGDKQMAEGEILYAYDVAGEEGSGGDGSGDGEAGDGVPEEVLAEGAVGEGEGAQGIWRKGKGRSVHGMRGR